MKKIFLLLLAAGALFSCQEEFIGQYSTQTNNQCGTGGTSIGRCHIELCTAG